MFAPGTFAMLGLPSEWYGALEFQYPPHQRQGSYEEEGRAINTMKARGYTVSMNICLRPIACRRFAVRSRRTATLVNIHGLSRADWLSSRAWDESAWTGSRSVPTVDPGSSQATLCTTSEHR